MKKQELESRIKKLEEEVIYLRCRMMELEAQRVTVPVPVPYTPTPFVPWPLPPVITRAGTGAKIDLFQGGILNEI